MEGFEVSLSAVLEDDVPVSFIFEVGEVLDDVFVFDFFEHVDFVLDDFEVLDGWRGTLWGRFFIFLMAKI